MDYTKKIIYQSNYWYNDGLRKAQIRDLSGAILSLRRSLQYNRGNIESRNLLGLVYYGRGEVAEALVEWIISKNLRPRENPANYYVSTIQQAAGELETINQAVKKYNQCLVYSEQNGEDLAIIQLKKVIAAHPAFLKAYQLLALLYLHTEQYAKARQALRTARKLDTTNEMTLRYMHEMTQLRGKKIKAERSKKDEAVEYSLGNETIIQPRNSAWKEFTSKFTIMNILIGMVIGAAIIWYLVAPAVNQSRTDKMNKQMIEYSERINALEAQISAQTRTLDEYRSVNADTEAAAQTAASTLDSYETLMTVSEQSNSGSYTDEAMADTLISVNRNALGTDGQALFDQLASSIYPAACEAKYTEGVTALEAGNYERAVEDLSKVVRMDANYDEGGALLNLGVAYLRSGDNENAVKNLKQVITTFPDTERAKEAQANLDSISQSGTDKPEEADR